MKRSYETPAVECRMVTLASVIAASTKVPSDIGGTPGGDAKGRTYGAPANFTPQFDF